jgi:hypothetical protein
MTKPESRPALPAFLPWLVLLACSATPAQAENRTFFNPKLGGSPIPFCLTSTGGCGKAAADSFCRNSGYDTALTFARRQVMSEGEEPTGFTQIKCYKPSIEGSTKPAAITNTAAKSGRLVGANLK